MVSPFQKVALMFQPRVGFKGSFAPVSVIVQEFFAGFNVTGGHQNEVGRAINVMKFCLTVAAFAVIDQPSKTVGLFCGINTRAEKRRNAKSRKAQFL